MKPSIRQFFPRSQVLRRLPEAQAVPLHDEGDRIDAPPASHAADSPRLQVPPKAWAVVLVGWTKPKVNPWPGAFWRETLGFEEGGNVDPVPAEAPPGPRVRRVHRSSRLRGASGHAFAGSGDSGFQPGFDFGFNPAYGAFADSDWRGECTGFHMVVNSGSFQAKPGFQFGAANDPRGVGDSLRLHRFLSS